MSKTLRALVLLTGVMLVFVCGPTLLALGHVNFGYLQLIRIMSNEAAPGMYALDEWHPAPESLVTLAQVQQHFEQALNLEPSINAPVAPVLARIRTLSSGTVSRCTQTSAALSTAGARADILILGLGFSCLHAHQPDLAESIWKEWGAKMADFFAHRGDSLLDSANRERAYRYYRIAQAIRPNDPALDVRVILAGFMTGRADLARQEVSTLIDGLPPDVLASAAARLHAAVNDAFIWVLIAAADAYLERGAAQHAEQMLLRAYRIQLDPISISRLGSFYCSQGRYEEGIDVLKKAQVYEPQYYALESRQRLSICYCRAGRRDDAMREAETLARIAPADSDFTIWPKTLDQHWLQLCEMRR